MSEQQFILGMFGLFSLLVFLLLPTMIAMFLSGLKYVLYDWTELEIAIKSRFK